MVHTEISHLSSHTTLRQRRRLATHAVPSSCSKSFARYCVALLGSLTTVSLAASVPSVSASLLREGYEHGLKISRTVSTLEIDGRGPVEPPHLNLRTIYARANSQNINKAAIIVGICGGLGFVFAIIGGMFFWRIRRQKHIKGTCGCDEKGIACKYRQIPSETTLGHHSDDEDEDERSSRPRERGISPPVSPRQSLLSPPAHKQPGERNRWSISSSPRNSGPFYDVEGFEYPPNYKPPPSAFRSHSPSASAEFLVPAGIASLVSPVTPLLSHRGLPISHDDGVSITPPRTPSPAIFAKRASSPSLSRVVSPDNSQLPGPSHFRGRSLSAVDLSRTDGELQHDLDAIVRELQRRPRAGSIDSRLVQSRSNTPPPPAAAQEFIMELEASPGMWNEDMQRNRGANVVHEAVSQEFAVELDSRPLTLGLKRPRRVSGRFQ